MSIVADIAVAEGASFSRAEMDRLIDLAAAGIAELCKRQRAALELARGGGR